MSAVWGAADSEIIPLLHRLRGITFFTQDADFFKPTLCHQAYCLVWLDVHADDAAYFVRRFLRLPRFHTKAKRLGTVIRVHRNGIQFYRCGTPMLQRAGWER